MLKTIQKSLITQSKLIFNFSKQVKFTFIKRDGTKKPVIAKEGQHILQVAKQNDVQLQGACQASLACSTCHVILPKKIYDKLSPAVDEEQDLLDLAFGLTPTSRLGCQVAKQSFQKHLVTYMLTVQNPAVIELKIFYSFNLIIDNIQTQFINQKQIVLLLLQNIICLLNNNIMTLKEKLTFNGSVLFHIFNTLFAILMIVQTCLYGSQGGYSQCPQMSSMFYGYMVTEILSFLVTVFSIICIYYRKFFNTIIIYGILICVSKVAVIASVLILNSSHLGLCYMMPSVRIGISIANAAECMGLIISLMYLIYVRDILQAQQIQKFIISNRSYAAKDIVYIQNRR